MAKLSAGDRAPGFALRDQDGNEVKLSHYQGKKILVYFYPKAGTSGCTKQACSVRHSLADLAAAGVVALGISPDEPDKQKKFDDKNDLGFPLLSDPDHAVADAYGVWGEKSMYGKKYEGVIRSSFLIDGDGKVVESWYKVRPADTVSKTMAAVGGDS